MFVLSSIIQATSRKLCEPKDIVYNCGFFRKIVNKVGFGSLCHTYGKHIVEHLKWKNHIDHILTKVARSLYLL